MTSPFSCSSTFLVEAPTRAVVSGVGIDALLSAAEGGIVGAALAALDAIAAQSHEMSRE